MDIEKLKPAAALAGAGLAAGLVGSIAMLLSQKLEMRLTERPPSKVPVQAVEKISGLDLEGRGADQQLSTAAHFAFGTGLGLGLPLLARLPEPARAAAFFVAVWSAGTGLITALGLAKPPTAWEPEELATDLGHHAVYAAAAAATFAGLRRGMRPHP